MAIPNLRQKKVEEEEIFNQKKVKRSNIKIGAEVDLRILFGIINFLCPGV